MIRGYARRRNLETWILTERLLFYKVGFVQLKVFRCTRFNWTTFDQDSRIIKYEREYGCSKSNRTNIL